MLWGWEAGQLARGEDETAVTAWAGQSGYSLQRQHLSPPTPMHGVLRHLTVATHATLGPRLRTNSRKLPAHGGRALWGHALPPAVLGERQASMRRSQADCLHATSRTEIVLLLLGILPGIIRGGGLEGAAHQVQQVFPALQRNSFCRTRSRGGGAVGRPRRGRVTGSAQCRLTTIGLSPGFTHALKALWKIWSAVSTIVALPVCGAQREGWVGQVAWLGPSGALRVSTSTPQDHCVAR